MSSLSNVERLTLVSGGAGNPSILSGTVDPSAGGGVAAAEGSLLLRFVAGAGELWEKIGAPDTAWGIASSGVSFGARVVTVAAGTPIATIAAGLTAATALVPTAGNPVLVWVMPGTYVEGALTVPSGVILASAAPHQSQATIAANAPAITMVTVAAGATIRGFQLVATGLAGVTGIAATAPGVSSIVEINVIDCDVGYAVSGGAFVNGTLLTAARTSGAGAGTAGFQVTGASTLRVSTAAAVGFPATDPWTRGVSCTGVGSTCSIVAAGISDNTDGVFVDDGGLLEVLGGAARRNATALHVGVVGTAGTLRTFTLAVSASVTNDVLLDGAAAAWNDAGSTIDENKRVIPVGAAVSAISLAETPITGERSVAVLGEFHVGSETAPAESAFGEGDGHVRGLSALKSTVLDAGPFVDITAIVESRSGSTVAAFTTGAVSNALFFGGDLTFPSIKVDTTTAIALGAGALVCEVSDGVGGWIVVDTCVCDGLSPYLSHAEDLFGRIASEQIRFGDTTGWAAQLINGISKFWFRIRVITAVLATNPVIESMKLGTNRVEINEDGGLEKFGTAETVQSLRWHQHLVNDLGGSASGNNPITISTNITANLTDNQFANNALDGIAGLIEIPEGADTSRPLTLEFTWIPKATPGNVEFETRSSLAKIGDVLDGTAADVLQTAIVAAPAVDVLGRQMFSYDISTLVPGDFVGFSLFRDAAAGNLDDTLAGSINLVTVDFLCTFWR